MPNLAKTIKADMREFIGRMALGDIDLRQLGIIGKTIEMILDKLRILFG